MKLTPEPRIYRLGYTAIDLQGIEEFLGDPAVGVSNPNAMANDYAICADPGEALIELAGRSCYRSFEPNLNPNVTRVREGNAAYIKNIIKQKHGSVLEHASVTFAFVGVSRVFTHEIVRHRAGTAFSQESLRYVRLDQIPFWMSPTLRESDETRDGVIDAVTFAETQYMLLCEMFGIADMDDFEKKKVITSALRRIAPIGLSTSIIVTANHRAWRHIIEQRCTKHAEEEIRLVISKVASRLKNQFEAIYSDMYEGDPDCWYFEHSKI